MKYPRSIYIKILSVAVVLAISHVNVYAQKTPTPTPTPPEAQTTPALPDARVGIEYKFELKAEMGTPPLKWSLAQGPLPPGIELSDKGIIHGVPLAGTQSPVVFAVEVSDASSPPWQTKMYFSLSVSHEGVLNPATFIRILEDPKSGSRQTIYEPSQHALARHIQGTADEGSMIVIRPVAGLMSDDVALNKLYITAKLASGDSSKDVPVVGYSEIGKDKATMASQTATAFESASNIKTMVLDMSYTVDDIIRRVYDSCLQTANTGSLLTFDDWKKQRDIDLDGDCVKTIDKKIAAAVRSTATEAQPKPPSEAQPKPPEELDAFKERLRLYQPEIQNIAGFFSNTQNLAIVEKIGADVFWIDRDTLESIAKQYKANVQALAEPAITDQRKAQIYDDLLERTKLIYRDFSDLRAKILSVMCTEDKCSGKHSKDEWEQFYQEATQKVANGMQKSALAGLKRLLAPGTISLAEQKAKDGDRLTITVETVPSNATSGGIQTVFEITVKKYGVKVGLGSSLLFIRRLGVTDAEAAPPTGSNTVPIINRVNFAPSPGVTFAMAFFKRGNSGWDKFLRGLGPGAGINVSFMNFNDPSFDLSTNKFVNTTGANVQVGSGIIGSLFDNKIQVSYGWNLNVEQRRNYFGVGFDFIKAGESVAKLFK